MKRILLVLGLGLLSTGSLAAQTLIHYYAGGENDGSVTAGSTVTTTQDAGSSGSNMSRYAINGVTYSSSTYGGDSTLAYAFDGTNFLVTSTDTTLTNSSSFIYELWFNASALSGTQNLLYDGYTNNNGIGLYLSGSSLTLLRGGVALTNVATVNTSTWYYAALVYDAGNTTVYLNGTAYAMGTLSFNDPAAGGLMLGANQVAGDQFTGLLDDVRISTFTSGTFSSSMLSYSAVPEPATWAMIFGLCALVAAIWRRRRITT